jgi:UDP-N-acetylmuramate dehydrogenase
MPVYPHGQDFKIAAGWLIDMAGLKGYQAHGIRVSDKQALVLINESAEHFSDLQNMYEYIQSAVFEKFGVHLEPEPELL